MSVSFLTGLVLMQRSMGRPSAPRSSISALRRDVEAAAAGGDRPQHRRMGRRLHRVMQAEPTQMRLQQPALLDDPVGIEHKQGCAVLRDQRAPALGLGSRSQRVTHCDRRDGFTADLLGCWRRPASRPLKRS